MVVHGRLYFVTAIHEVSRIRMDPLWIHDRSYGEIHMTKLFMNFIFYKLSYSLSNLRILSNFLNGTNHHFTIARHMFDKCLSKDCIFSGHFGVRRSAEFYSLFIVRIIPVHMIRVSLRNFAMRFYTPLASYV